jgi:twitching motility protein PilT
MQTMEQCLIRLITEGRIGMETGLSAARNENLLRQRLSVHRMNAPAPVCAQPERRARFLR